MDLVSLEPAVSFLPMLLVLAGAALGFLCLAGGRKAYRVAGLPFLVLMALVLALAWLISAT